MSRPTFWTRFASPDGTLPRSTRLVAWPVSFALGALIVAVSAQVAFTVPLSPVPMTLQGLAVIAVGGLFGPVAGTGALVTYLVAGLLGAPVFAQGASGMVRLLGPTGGYLLAFPVAALIAGTVGQRGNLLRSFAGALLAMLTIHLGGWAWLALGLGGERATTVGVAPFLVPDALKVVLAALIMWRAQRALSPNA